jgi:predicted secreted protein
MVEYLGRDLEVYKGAMSPPVRILGLREKGITCAGEVVDVTTDDDDGFVRKLGTFGSKQITIALAGLPTNEVMRNAWMAGNIEDTYTLVWPDGATLVGEFIQANYNPTHPHNDAATWSVELQSTGPWVFTPPA